MKILIPVIDKNKKNIVTVARVSQEKRIDWVPNVCKDLKDKFLRKKGRF